MVLIVPFAWADRTPLKPGMNMFTPEQDIELGKQASAEVEKQVSLLNDAQVNQYLNRVGQRLVAQAPGYKFPYQFKAVNDAAINAFALPGGFLYVNRGVIDAASSEAQLAGVMAHEVSHAALRHGTNQATKAQLTSVPFAILGGMFGGNSVAGLLAQLGASFSLNSILLKYSRDDETQADVMGTQMLYDAGYDPRAMSQFFEQLQAESKGKNPPQFFSSHPNPANRAQRVTQEIDNLGGLPRNYTSNSSEFTAIKNRIRSMPPAPAPPKAGAAAAPSARPGPPSSSLNRFQNDLLELRYPDNWKVNESGTTFAILPQGGAVADGKGQSAMAYGVMFNSIQPTADARGRITLEAATGQLVTNLRRSNPDLRAAGTSRRIRVGGVAALAGNYTNASPLGGGERIWLVSFLRPDGLMFFLSVAPEGDFNAYQPAFQTLVNSVRFGQ